MSNFLGTGKYFGRNHCAMSQTFWPKITRLTNQFIPRISKYSNSKFTWNILFKPPARFFKWSWVSDACVLEHSWILQLDVIYCVCKCLNDSWIFQVMPYSACARAFFLSTTPAVHHVWRAAWILFSGIHARRVPIAYSTLEFLTRIFRFCWLNFATVFTSEFNLTRKREIPLLFPHLDASELIPSSKLSICDRFLI